MPSATITVAGRERSLREIVEEIRIDHDLSQEEIAVGIGVGIDALRRWIYNGKSPSEISRTKILRYVSRMCRRVTQPSKTKTAKTASR